jgi:division protein CdvB (Snf7/Vps24/ESCRT-III family)
MDENIITLACANRLMELGYTDDDLDAMGPISEDIFLEGFIVDTLRTQNINELAGMQTAGLGSKIKKKLKKIKKKVKKVVKKVTKPIKKVTSTLSRKLLPDSVAKLGKKIDDAVIQPALLPVTVAYKTPSEVVETIKDSNEVLQRTFVPDKVYDAAKKFEQKHRPLLKQIAFTVASVVGSIIMGPGALTMAQVAMESIKQLALDIALTRVAERVAEIKAKRDQREIDAEMAKINEEIAQIRAEIEAELQAAYNANIPAIVDQYLSEDQRTIIKERLATIGPDWLDSAEAAQMLQPIISALSGATAKYTSTNPLAPVAAEIAANDEMESTQGIAPSSQKSALPVIMSVIGLLTLLK